MSIDGSPPPTHPSSPTPLSLPGPVVKISIDSNIFIQLTSGVWVGRGMYDSYCFPVSDADLIDGPDDDRLLPGWTPVNAEYAENLNAQEAADSVMFLPEPIANA